MIAQDGPKACGLDPHLADPSDAGQPPGLDVLGVGVDLAHLQERNSPDGGDHQKQERDNRKKFGANG